HAAEGEHNDRRATHAPRQPPPRLAPQPHWLGPILPDRSSTIKGTFKAPGSPWTKLDDPLRPRFGHINRAVAAHGDIVLRIEHRVARPPEANRPAQCPA